VTKLTALAAVYGDRNCNANGLITNMLHALSHRGDRVKIECNNDQAGVGYASSSLPGGFFESKSSTVILDGLFFRRTFRGQTRLALEESSRSFRSIMKIPGAFAEISYRPNRLTVVRDPNGLRPLYHSTHNGVTAIASERKALWRIGHTKTERIFPGYLYAAHSYGMSKRRLFRFSPPRPQAMTLEYAAARLKRHLQRSIKLITANLDHVAVAFSGGLDSAITALLAKQANLQVELVSTGLRDSAELQTVEKYAKALDLPISIEAYEADSVEHFLRRIIWLIEEHDLMRVSIAVPMHWAALLAARRGHSVMLCGQGSDELYGGYYKYAKILDNKGRTALLSALYSSIVEAPQVNYERDEQATCPTGVELRTPFANLDVIDFSLRIPLEFKVKPGNDLVRKWVLRAAAQKAGLPEEMVWRRKKAIQHGTGVEKAIQRLARRQKLSTHEYLARISTETSKLSEMPLPSVTDNR